MKLAVKTRPAPTTASGSARNTAASFGVQARSTQRPIAANAITRLVAPLAWATPTRLGALPIPGTPSTPPTAQPIPSARTPP